MTGAGGCYGSAVSTSDALSVAAQEKPVLALLRPRRERPRRCRTAEQRNELAAFTVQRLLAHSSVRQETAALRDFEPAYDRFE